MEVNFWDLNWGLYMLGFILLPRLTIIIIFNNYVTNGFEWYNLFVSITVWWMYPVIALNLISKLAFSILDAFFPRLLLGIIGYVYLSSSNHGVMLVFCIIGLLIDIAVKVVSSNSG